MSLRIRCLKRLPESHKVLRRLHPGDGIQVAADVDSNRPHFREISKSETNVICVVARELTQADRAVRVTTIVENHAAKVVDELDRKASFRIDDRQHAAAVGDTDQRARRRIIWIGANGHRTLRTGAIDWEPTQ